MRRKFLIRQQYFAVDSIRETLARPSSAQAWAAGSWGAGTNCPRTQHRRAFQWHGHIHKLMIVGSDPVVRPTLLRAQAHGKSRADETGFRGVLSCRFHPTAPLVGAPFRPLCIHAPSPKKLTMLPPRARPIPYMMDLIGVVFDEACLHGLKAA